MEAYVAYGSAKYVGFGEPLELKPQDGPGDRPNGKRDSEGKGVCDPMS